MKVNRVPEVYKKSERVGSVSYDISHWHRTRRGLKATDCLNAGTKRAGNRISRSDISHPKLFLFVEGLLGQTGRTSAFLSTFLDIGHK